MPASTAEPYPRVGRRGGRHHRREGPMIRTLTSTTVLAATALLIAVGLPVALAALEILR